MVSVVVVPTYAAVIAVTLLALASNPLASPGQLQIVDTAAAARIVYLKASIVTLDLRRIATPSAAMALRMRVR